MQQNSILEQLFIERHSNLIDITHFELSKIDDDNIDNSIEAEDIVQDLYLELAEEGIQEDAVDELGIFSDSYVYVILANKLSFIIVDKYLVDTE